MENIDSSSESLPVGIKLSLSEKSKRFLSEAGKWGRFIAIVGFVGIGFLVIGGIFAGAIFANIPGYEEIPGGLFSAIYILLAILYFFPVLYLYRFSTKIRQALNSDDESVLEYALENLKSHYKFIGILIIVMLALYSLIFLMVMVGGVLATM